MMSNHFEKSRLHKTKAFLLALFVLFSAGQVFSATTTTSPALNSKGSNLPALRANTTPVNDANNYSNVRLVTEYHLVYATTPPTAACSAGGQVTQGPTAGSQPGTYVYQCVVPLNNKDRGNFQGSGQANTVYKQLGNATSPNQWVLNPGATSGTQDWASFSSTPAFPTTGYRITNYVYLGPGNSTNSGGYIIWEANGNNYATLKVGSAPVYTVQGPQNPANWSTTNRTEYEMPSQPPTGQNAPPPVLDSTAPGQTVQITKTVVSYYNGSKNYIICSGNLTVDPAWVGQTVYVDCCITNAADTLADLAISTSGGAYTVPTRTSPASPVIKVSTTSNQPCTQ